MAGIYRSRVFNFINSQTNRFKNSLGQSWRQVKVSVQWTGQILLSPLRWFNWLIPAPESQMPGKNDSQLPLETPINVADNTTTISHQTAAVMTAKDANQAIKSILATIVAAGHGQSSLVVTPDDWSMIDENEWETAFLDESHRSLIVTAPPPSLTPQRPVIQGLATQLSNRHLVLIDQHNQVLDILSPSQQLYIHQQIKPIMTPALQPAAAQLAMASPAALNPAQPLVVGATAPQPPTTWQKIGYWCKFYLEYFRVDVNVDAPAIPPPTLPTLLHKSLAITPTAISSIDPSTTHSSPLNTTSPSPNPTSGNLLTNNSINSIAWENSSAIDIKTASPQSQVDFQPKWIEAPTETLGYERSLLRQLWIWLDRLMLKIENWVIGIYQKLTKAR